MRVEWIELDVWARATGNTLAGDATDVTRHLLSLCGPDGRVGHEVKAMVVQLDSHLHEQITTSVVTLTTPWGRYRWIPRPHRRRERSRSQ
jgi:hypothetical protein